MQLSKIKIKNYRLLIDAELEVESKTTLIVGRNNTANRIFLPSASISKEKSIK